MSKWRKVVSSILILFSFSIFPTNSINQNFKIFWAENGKIVAFNGYEFTTGYVKDYDFSSNDLELVYFKGGVTSSYVKSKYPKAKKIFPAGYSWKRKPVDYVEINGKIIQPRTNLRAVLGLIEKNNVFELVSAYDPKIFPYENRKWLVALGPWWNKKSENNFIAERGEVGDDGIYDINRDESRYRYTDRNALFFNDEGIRFAVFSGKASVRGVIAIAREMGWNQVFILDAGSSLSPKTKNPVYFVIK